MQQRTLVFKQPIVRDPTLGVSMDWSEIGKYVGILAAAIGGAGLVLKFSSSRSSKSKKNTRVIIQKNNTAGGDIIGGDSKKTVKK